MNNYPFWAAYYITMAFLNQQITHQEYTQALEPFRIKPDQSTL